MTENPHCSFLGISDPQGKRLLADGKDPLFPFGFNDLEMGC